MTRSHNLLALTLLVFGVVFALQNTRANDGDIPSESTIQTASDANQLDLLSRIEALEKRIAKLEAEKSLVQQADNQETRYIPAPRTLPQVAPSENDDTPPRKTNGTTWRIRMLSHRSSADRPN
jgi:hypothetical protein